MAWKSTDPKPRYGFCWLCSRRLHGRQHAEVEIDGRARILHKDCAATVNPEASVNVKGAK